MICAKKRFTKERAAKVLKDVSVWRIWGDSNRREQRSYFCQPCNAYHLTSYTEEEWAKRKAEKGVEVAAG